jgi:hypothetical protein
VPVDIFSASKKEKGLKMKLRSYITGIRKGLITETRSVSAAYEYWFRTHLPNVLDLYSLQIKIEI